MPALTTPGQRFTQLIQQLGLTKNAFAQSLGKTATVIQHIVDERNKPGYDLMNKVREVYPNVSSDWLLSGDGPMLRDGSQPSPSAAATESAPASNGINLADIPDSGPRRRTSSLLQPADIAATLALATPGHPSPSQYHNGQHHNGAAAKPAAPPPAAAGSELPPAAAATLGQSPPPPLTQPAAPSPPAAPLAAAPPDPTYLAAALHTMQLQHQLALAEQRNQHLLEQQALLRQMVELLQKTA